MSLFAQLDTQLMRFAAAQGAVLTRDRRGQSLLPAGPNMVGFEERRIDWQRQGLNLALIIQPNFLVTGVDTSKWNLRLVAWQGSGHHKHTLSHNLVTSGAFHNIADHLPALLLEAQRYLAQVQPSDLQPLPYMREQQQKRASEK